MMNNRFFLILGYVFSNDWGFMVVSSKDYRYYRYYRNYRDYRDYRELVVQDQCRLRVDGHPSTLDGAQSALIDDVVAAHHGELSLWNLHHLWLLVGIEHHDDVVPCVATSMAAVTSRDRSIRMSRGPSALKLNPRPDSSN